MSITISGNGIVEANLADNAVTLAKMASGTDGEILTYDASGNPVAVSVGTSGQVLTSGGTGAAPTFQAAAGGGKVLQVVNAYKTNYSTTSSTTFADSGLSVTITPTLATSSIMLLINFQNVWMPTASDQRLWIKLLRDSTGLQNMSTTIGHSSANERVGTWSGVWIDSPSTTSSTVYKMQMRAQQTGSTIYFNYNAGQSEVGTSTITAIEIGA